MKKTKAKFTIGQIIDKLMSVEPETYVPVSILERRWAGQSWFYRIEYSNNATSWVLESQLRAPIGEPA